MVSKYLIKKVFLVNLFCIFSFFYVYSEDFSVINHPHEASLEFIGNKVFYTTDVYNDCIDYESSYFYEMRDGLNYIHFNNPINRTFLLLRSKEFSVLVNEENFKEIFGINTTYKRPKARIMSIFEACLLHPPEIIDASSFLKEGFKEYRPENLSLPTICYPWIEGVSGNGIGETVTFKAYGNRNIHTLIISIGYVNFKKPYLYKDNSRPKKIRIWFDKKTNYIDVNLKDTPNPQIINLPYFEDEIITLEILDVYVGRKWEDTCINFLYTVSGMEDYFNCE